MIAGNCEPRDNGQRIQETARIAELALARAMRYVARHEYHMDRL